MDNDMKGRHVVGDTIAGIDVGGTKIRWVIMARGARGRASRHRSFPWRIVSSGEIPTPHERARFLDAMGGIVVALRTRGAARIGLGVAGRLARDTIRGSTNLPFLTGIHLPTALGDRGLRCDNDARCFAHAEAALAAPSGTALVVTVGTGIGRALIRHGRVDSPVLFEDLEPWEPAYRRMIAGGHTISAQALASFLGPRLAALAATHGADTIILGGGRFRTKGLFSKIKKEIYAARPLRVRRAHFRQNEGAIGAALRSFA